MKPSEVSDVPVALRRWFIFHFFADVLFAVPLFFAPEAFLGLLGWSQVDPFAARGVAAALFGIGAQSILDRDAGVASYRTMLSLKAIWATFASIGFLWGCLTAGFPMAWVIFAVFAGFDLVWIYWLWRLGRSDSGPSGA